MKEGFKEGAKALYTEIKTWNLGYKIERTFALTASLVWGFFAIGLLYVAYQLTTVEGEIDASIFEKDKTAGTYSIGHVKTKNMHQKPLREIIIWLVLVLTITALELIIISAAFGLLWDWGSGVAYLLMRGITRD